MFSALLFATLLVAVQSACDNACSGHGKCLQQGICECFDNWGMGLGHLSGDCSERICPFELAWVDTPDSLGNFHKYAECSNKGICNRGSGECECFPGYEGKGCQRTACPNDCSGHGRCKYIEDLPAAQVFYAGLPTGGNFRDSHEAETFSYFGWDNYKTRGCDCDPEFGDVDCSKRLCMHGNDVMDQRDNLLLAQKYQMQKITLRADDPEGGTDPKDPVSDYSALKDKTFALTFRSKLNETYTTIPIPFYNFQGGLGNTDGLHEFLLDVEEALERLPNKVIDNVEVHGSIDDYNTIRLNITFVGENVQGPQNLLTVKSIMCGDGCTPKLSGLELQFDSQNITQVVMSDFNSYECGRRGKCDYTTGLCQCFAGYTGLSCSTIACLV